MKHTALFLLTSVVAVAALTACATTPLNTDRVSASQAAIQSADAVGAGKYPEAALHVRLAQEELAQAQALAKEGNAARADSIRGQIEIYQSGAAIRDHRYASTPARD